LVFHSSADCTVIYARFFLILLEFPALDTKNIICDVTPCILATLWVSLLPLSPTIFMP